MAKKTFIICGAGLQSYNQIIVNQEHQTKANREGPVGSLRGEVNVDGLHGRNTGSSVSVEEIQPGVVSAKRIARKTKRCSACHCLIMPGESYWDRKINWQRYSQPICEKCKEALDPTIKVDKPEEVLHDVGHVVEACWPPKESTEEAVERLRKTWPLIIGDAGLQELQQILEPGTGSVDKSDGKLSQSLPGTQVLIDRFLEAKKSRLKPASITSYGDVLRPFARAYPQLPIKPEPLEAYLANFSNENTTARHKFNVLRAFYNWLSHRGKITVNPIKMVEKPAGQADETLPLNEEQARALHDAPKTDREQGYVGLMLDHGFRLSEVIRLNVGDIHEDRIWVHGKERKEWFPLLREVRDWLLKLADGRAPDEPLFFSRQGRLSDSQVQLDIEKLLVRVGIDGVRQSPHTLRHTFSTLAYLAGCDWDAVELLLRQKEKKRNVTNRYIHLSPEQHLKLIRQKLENYSPLRTLAKTELGKKPDFAELTDDTLAIGDPTKLLPELLDRMIALGQLAQEVKHALGGNGHRKEQLEEIKELLEHRACK